MQSPNPSHIGSNGPVHPAVIRQISDELTRMRGDMAGAARALATVEAKLKSRRVPRYLEDIPGKRSAYWYVLQVLFDDAISNGSEKNATVSISQEGPFIWHNMTVLWQVTTLGSGDDADMHRAYVPPTRLGTLMRAITAAPTVDRNLIDFNVELRTSSNRALNNGAVGVPAPALWRENRPEYLAVPHWLERADTVTARAIAQVSGTAANAPQAAARGTLWVILGGYQILMPIDYASAFGSLEEEVA